MNKKRSSRIIGIAGMLVLLLTVSSCAEQGQLPGKAFEGTITEVIQMPGLADLVGQMADSGSNNSGEGSNMAKSMLGAAANMRIKIYVKGDKVAYDMSMLGGLIDTRAIIDGSTRTMTMLMPGHTAMVQNLRSLDSMRTTFDDSLKQHSGVLDSLANLLPQPTGKTETIEGLKAEEYHATKGSMDVTMWLSSDEKMKSFEIIRDAFLGRQRTGEGGLEQVFDVMRPIAGKVPVKFETKMNGKTMMKGDLKDISEETVDPSIFEIPQGYTIVNSDSMRQAHKEMRKERQKTVTGPSEDTTGE